MRMRQLVGLLCGSLLFCSSANAVSVPGLFRAQLHVSDQSRQVREQALQQGLLQVLVKNSGNPALGSIPSIQAQLQQAGTFLQSYRYQLLSGDPGQTATVQLNLTFNPKAVVSLLQRSDQAVWGQDRPSILVWLVRADGQALQPVGDDITTPLAQTVLRAAKLRGLPLSFPLFDMTDWNHVSLATLAKPDVLTVQQASQRYHPNVILMGKVNSSSPQHWTVDWTLLVQGDQLHWEFTATDLSHLMENSLDTIMAALSDRFAVIDPVAASAQTLLTISDIQSVAGFAKLLRYLKHLAPVEEVNIVTVTPHQVVYRLTYNGGIAGLTRAIALDPLLVPDAKQQVSWQSDNLAYRLST